MAPESDRSQVLKMVEAGTISAADGARLIGTAGTQRSSWTSRWLRIRVTDLATQRQRVTVNLPLAWVALGLKIGSRYSPELAQIDLNEIMAEVQRGAQGRIVEVEDVESGERVEVYVD